MKLQKNKKQKRNGKFSFPSCTGSFMSVTPLISVSSSFSPSTYVILYYIPVTYRVCSLYSINVSGKPSNISLFSPVAA